LSMSIYRFPGVAAAAALVSLLLTLESHSISPA
jgi:hypothetical protein